MSRQEPSAAAGKAGGPSAKPLEIAPNCWLVGRRDPASILQCNTYLRDLDGGGSRLRICIDPGSQLDFPVIRENIQALIGDLRELDGFTLNHQDPDVVANAPLLCEANPNISMALTEDVYRLVQHLSFQPGRVYFANAERSNSLDLGQGRRWQLVPTPFCHFRGAMAFYDPEIRTLFTGDLLGGLNEIGRIPLFVDEEEEDWIGVAQFHQIYMPSRDVLRYAVRQIQALQPAVEVIAPQHGHVIKGDQVPLYLERLHELLVGHDLLAVELDEAYLAGYQEVISQLFSWGKEIMGKTEVVDRLSSKQVEDQMEPLVRIDGEDVRLEKEGYSALVKVFSRLAHGHTHERVNTMRSRVLEWCQKRGLPIPPIGVGLADEGVVE